MRKIPIRRRETQLSLFHPRPQTPLWSEIPIAFRRTATRLIARLLREHRARLLASENAKETADE